MELAQYKCLRRHARRLDFEIFKLNGTKFFVLYDTRNDIFDIFKSPITADEAKNFLAELPTPAKKFWRKRKEGKNFEN